MKTIVYKKISPHKLFLGVTMLGTKKSQSEVNVLTKELENDIEIHSQKKKKKDEAPEIFITNYIKSWN
jgi:hypothetical protein